MGLNTCYFVVLVVISMIMQVAIGADLYKILGVEPNVD
jgi:hypothetical protein